MNIKDLSKLIKEYRETKKLSQGQLAEKLGFTQATISRIEGGKQLPRHPQLQQLYTLLNIETPRDETAEDEIAFSENFLQFKNQSWNCFWATRKYGNTPLGSGDVVIVKEFVKNRQLSLILADNVGHGIGAAYMSFALELAYFTISSVLNPSLLSSELFDKAFGAGIFKTGSAWLGEPSMGIAQIDFDANSISYINRGMPYPIIIESDKVINLTERSAAYSLTQLSTPARANHRILAPGESAVFYTDGVLDVITDAELTPAVQKIGKLFKGDARAIGKNLVRLLKNSNKVASDDVSFLVLSRSKKGKTNA